MDHQEKYEDFMSHFHSEVNEDLKKFVRDDALLHSRYLFVRRVASTIQRGYCTHCKSDYVIKSQHALKHNVPWQCEMCKSLVIVKQAGRGRGQMVDTAYVIWYEKSKSNPGSITAIGYKVTMDYREDIKGITTYFPVAKYVFEDGKATMMHRRYDDWIFARKPHTLLGKHYFTIHSLQSIESIIKAVKGTKFNYSLWHQFADYNNDLIYFFSAFAKYPFIEYLTKMGMDRLVQSIINREPLYKSLNLRGKTMERILGLSKREVKDWKASGVTMYPIILKTYKWFRSNRTPITWDTADKCGNLLVIDYYFEKLIYFQNRLPLHRIIRYAMGQIQKNTEQFTSITGVLSDWKDYLEECKELQMDVKEEKVLLPNNLYMSHQKSTRAIKVKKDEGINKKIAEMQPKLKKYRFENDGLLIRPAISSMELFDEGKALDHCVGRYADKYAKGESIILFVRKFEDPDTPFFTVEMNNKTKSIVQCRGLKNCNPPEDVLSFLKTFESERLSKNKGKSKGRKGNVA